VSSGTPNPSLQTRKISTYDPHRPGNRDTSSQGELHVTDPPATFLQIEKENFKQLRFQYRTCCGSQVLDQAFHPILKPDMRAQSSDIARRLLHDPLSVRDRALMQSPGLYRGNSSPDRNECVYYIRTFSLRKNQLMEILTKWEIQPETF